MADVEAKHCDNGDQRVLQGVMEQNVSTAHAFGAGEFHIVLLHIFLDAGTRYTQDCCAIAQGKRKNRHYQIFPSSGCEKAESSRPGRGTTGGGQYLKGDGEHINKHHAHPE